MIRDIQRDEDHDEATSFLLGQIARLENRLEDYPISFTKAGFIGYTITVVCIGAVVGSILSKVITG